MKTQECRHLRTKQIARGSDLHRCIDCEKIVIKSEK